MFECKYKNQIENMQEKLSALEKYLGIHLTVEPKLVWRLTDVDLSGNEEYTANATLVQVYKKNKKAPPSRR